MEEILPLGILNFRGKEVKFGIKPQDRLRHIYIIGKTGSGKTTLLENMMIFDIENKNGFAFIDAHGDTCERLLKFVPKERIEDVIYFNPADLNYPFSFNILSQVPWEFRHILVSGLMSVFKKIWVDAWSSRMEYILTNTLLALVEFPDSTLLDVNRMLADKNFREKVIEKLKDPVVKNFWTQEYSRYTQAFQVEAIAPIQNKIGQFLTSPLIRNIIGQKESKIDFRKLMDEKKIFIANISKGLIGEDNAALLGAMLVTKIQLAAMSRADIPEQQRVDFYLYVDEFQNFATDSFINILSEARKYHLSLILANQYLDQLPDKIKTAIIGNIGTIIAFRVGPLDAEILAKEFGYLVKIDDFVNLPSYYVYIKLLVDGKPTSPFLAKTLPPPARPEISYKDEIINLNHLKYARRRSLVEGRIAQIFSEIKKEGKELIYCRECRQPFLSSGEEICDDCQAKVQVGISLKKAVETQIIVEKKKEEKINKNNLDDILKKLGG
jgi:hypothetical protein